MTDVTASNGTVLHINDNSVTIVMGPYPDDPPNRSYVFGPAPAAIAIDEDAATFVARLHPTVTLAALTRPNHTPIWIKGAAITLVRHPVAGDTAPGETVGAVLSIGTHHQYQAIVETVANARAIINAHSGRV